MSSRALKPRTRPHSKAWLHGTRTRARCHRRRTKEFRKFGGPIQLASNAMESLRSLDGELYSEIEGRATWTGNRTNGIKDGIRDEWCASLSRSLSRSLSLTRTTGKGLAFAQNQIQTELKGIYPKP